MKFLGLWESDKMRTSTEILERIELRKPHDFFGFELSDYVGFLDFEDAKPFLKDGTTKEVWDATKLTDPVAEIKSYMAFAWDKANNCRGISASRSLSHMTAWLWLAGEDEFLDEHGDLQEYEHYGKAHLIAICEKYDIDWGPLDNGERKNTG